MSLDPVLYYSLPEDTARVARAAFPKGTVYMRMHDEFGALYDNPSFAPLFASRGRPAVAPARLALVTGMQYVEGLSDQQAAEAVRGRIDWKYALCLELDDPGFDSSVLSEFRARLIAGEAEHLLLDTLLARCRERQWLKARGRQRTDSTHVLAAVRALNRLELVGETLRYALNSLAVAVPDWLVARSRPEWADRYARRVEDYRLPAGQDARQALAEAIGADGYALLAAVYGAATPPWLRELPAVETLRRVWVQQYTIDGGRGRWRTADELPPAAQFISSPYDQDAHYAKKRTMTWVGYKVHVTETCEDDLPRLITHVETTTGPTDDGAVTPTIHAALQEKALLPSIHIVDTGFLDAELLATSRREHAVDLLGPVREDHHWQARAGRGFSAEHFAIDWERQRATCPEGRTSVSWTPAVDNRTNAVIKLKFAAADCRACPSRADCTQAVRARRTLTIRPREQYEALQAARARAETRAFATEYARRAGIEGTLSRGMRRCGLRQARYIGLAKTTLQHVVTATALNFLRIDEWLEDPPRAPTRRSPFAKLMAQAA